jgi:SAM-dependent methyltransferase
MVKRFDRVRDAQSTAHFGIVRCEACGLGRTTPEPEDLSPYYGPAYYGGRHSVTARYCTARRLRILGQSAKRPGKLLDIGCGDGSFLRAASGAGWHVTGTEIGGAAELSRALGIDVRDSLELAQDRGPFDAISMWHTLEHFRDPSAVVLAARAQLAQGGVLVIAVPNAAGLQATVFGAKWFHLDVPRHLFHFTRVSLDRMLRRSGLTVERWHHHELEVDVFGWLQSALNTIFPQPNLLFQSLTGKPSLAGPMQVALSYGIGIALGPAAAAATAVGAVANRGGTLTAIARPTSPERATQRPSH